MAVTELELVEGTVHDGPKAVLPAAPEGLEWGRHVDGTFTGKWVLRARRVPATNPTLQMIRDTLSADSTDEESVEQAMYMGLRAPSGIAAMLQMPLEDVIALQKQVRQRFRKPINRAEANEYKRLLLGSSELLFAKCWQALLDPKVSERGKQAAYSTAKGCLDFQSNLLGVGGETADTARLTAMLGAVMGGLRQMMVSVTDPGLLRQVSSLCEIIAEADLGDGEPVEGEVKALPSGSSD